MILNPEPLLPLTHKASVMCKVPLQCKEHERTWVRCLEVAMASRRFFSSVDGKSVFLSRIEALHTLCIHCFLPSPGETAILRQSVFVTAMCTTLHKFLVVISTNISIQQSFSSCIQLMVGELFFLICIMAYECVTS